MESPRTQHLRVLFTRKMEERKLFMEELHESRMQNYKENFRAIKRSIGPLWYQVLNERQQKALQTLKLSVYEDLLEGLPNKTTKILKALAIYPMPNPMDLMACMVLAKDDPKQVFAQLFYLYYHHDFSQKRCYPYPYNGRMFLTSIYYLGMNDLIASLEEKFAPPVVTPETQPKTKPKRKGSARRRPESPYLQYFTAVLYEPKQPKPKVPDPLPDLSSLNAPFQVEQPPLIKPAPIPPPPPPPKKRISQAACERMAGYIQIGPAVILTPPPSHRKSYMIKRLTTESQLNMPETKKVYGLSAEITRRRRKPRKPRIVPMPNVSNNRYLISGIHIYGNKPYFLISNISTLRTMGDTIHGGYRLLDGQYVRITSGIVDRPPSYQPGPCDCLTKWADKAISYLTSSKCRCGHYYDYYNEGVFPQTQPCYFKKPTRSTKPTIDLNAVLEMEPKVAHVQNECQKHWDEESLFQDDDDCSEVKKRRAARKKKEVVKIQSNCLGDRPKIEDYLRCALRFFVFINIAARLPEIHRAPELREWMHKRIYGEYTKEQKRRYLKKSRDYWTYLKAFQEMGLGKYWPEKNKFYEAIREPSTWKCKMSLQAQFRKYIADYKAKLFQTHAYFNNLLWATMYHPKFPDERFRDIFFCYLVTSVSDLTLIRPYNTMESEKRKREIMDKRLICLPKGAEDIDPEL